METVPQALGLISRKKFDVLLSDMNIGEPGDGFTLVSAMRRVQPEACTFILTGYPGIDSAIKAIHRQEDDDYFVKPWARPSWWWRGVGKARVTTRGRMTKSNSRDG